MKLILIDESSDSTTPVATIVSPKIIIGYQRQGSSAFELHSNLKGHELVGILENLKMLACMDNFTVKGAQDVSTG